MLSVCSSRGVFRHQPAHAERDTHIVGDRAQRGGLQPGGEHPEDALPGVGT